MNKKEYFILFIISLIVLSVSFIYQRVPGYMDSEYYYLGGKALASGATSLPVIWNYLDQPEILPHPLFTYWMPLPSIVTYLSIIIFGSSKFFISRILFWLLAAAIAPLSAYVSHQISKQRFSAWVSGILAIFSGYYFKFYTINETITLYIILGGVFFIIFSKLFAIDNRISPAVLCFLGGIVTGLMHMTRVDGFLLFLFGISLIFILIFKKREAEDGFSWKWCLYLIMYFVGYLLIAGWWYARNLDLFNSLFSPASSRALWIATYDDTFIYPATILNIDYWIANGLPLKLGQIWVALKSNVSTTFAVQANIFGLPLLVIGFSKLRKKPIIMMALAVWCMFFFLMSFVFSLAGGRGGFLHSGASVQIIFWCLISEGLIIFIQWGIRKRGWKLVRSQIMFGTALILFSIILTFALYYQNVIGDSSTIYAWESDNFKYSEIEEIIKLSANSANDAVMINNPVGYYYETNRWSVVIPNAKPDEFTELISRFNIKYIVFDNNLPEKLNNTQNLDEILKLKLIKQFEDGRKIYAIQ
jgi:hypothetical protein